MTEPLVALKIAHMKARDYEFHPDTYQDMVQEAAIAILNKPDKNPFTVAKYAINKAFFKWRWEEAPHAKRGESFYEKLEADVSFVIGNMRESQSTPLQERVGELVEMFYEMRKKKGKRGLAAAIQDANIIVLLERGFNNKAIAETLEVSINHIKNRRKFFKKIFQQMLEERGENE